MLGACAICQHLATIFVFLAIFVRLREARLDPTLLVGVSIGAFAVGYAIWAVLDCLNCRKAALPNNGSRIIFLVGVLLMNPNMFVFLLFR